MYSDIQFNVELFDSSETYFYESLIVNVTMDLVEYYVNLLMCGFLRFVFMNTKRFFQTVFLKAKQLRANLKVQVK